MNAIPRKNGGSIDWPSLTKAIIAIGSVAAIAMNSMQGCENKRDVAEVQDQVEDVSADLDEFVTLSLAKRQYDSLRIVWKRDIGNALGHGSKKPGKRGVVRRVRRPAVERHWWQRWPFGGGR